MAKVRLPAGPQELTADWLTSALRETGTISNSAVTGLDHEIIGEGVGVLGQLARFNLTYDSPEAGAPKSLIGKFPPFQVSPSVHVHTAPTERPTGSPVPPAAEEVELR